jgi:hypothetical protein
LTENKTFRSLVEEEERFLPERQEFVPSYTNLPRRIFFLPASGGESNAVCLAKRRVCKLARPVP